MSNKTLFGCLTAFLVLALVLSLAFNVLMALGGAMKWMDAPLQAVKPRAKFHEHLEQEGKSDSVTRIVRIDIEGIISSTALGGGFFDDGAPMVDTTKLALEQAVADPRVKAIVLRVNSPGGEVTASDTLYAAVKQAAGKKPVIVFMDSLAASGGYYISCGATKVVASETTLTGSIGVIMESLSYHEAFGKLGLGVQTFVSGNFKDTLGGHRPMREDEKAYVQNLVTQMYDRFLGIVADARKVPKDQLKNGVADGRVLMAREALEQKLVDQIGYIEDAYALARKESGAPDAMVVKYHRPTGFLEVLSSAEASSRQREIKVDILGGLAPKLEPGRAYYLPASYIR